MEQEIVYLSEDERYLLGLGQYEFTVNERKILRTVAAEALKSCLEAEWRMFEAIGHDLHDAGADPTLAFDNPRYQLLPTIEVMELLLGFEALRPYGRVSKAENLSPSLSVINRYEPEYSRELLADEIAEFLADY